jgi:hypothetical protein
VAGAVAGLLGANALIALAGFGVVGARRAGTAYLVGIALCGILAAELSVVGVAYGWTLLGLTAAGSIGFRLWTLRRARGGVRLTRPSGVALVAAAALAALFVRAAPTFAVRPFDAYDGWAMWGMKAHGLYTLDGADPALFASPATAPLHLDYPLFLPALEAVAFRALGSFDPQLVHLQFLLLLLAGVAALASILRGAAAPWVVWPAVVAVAAAPNVLLRLLTGYADLPLALFVATGLAAAGRWLLTREPFLLQLATLLFAAAALTKNEGAIFVGAAYLALLLTAWPTWRPLALSALVVEALLLPWQLYVKLEDIPSDSIFAGAFRFQGHLGVGPEALRRLIAESLSVRHWALLGPLFLLALGIAVTRSRRLALFASVWAGTSLAALTWIYMASPLEYSEYLDSSADRVVSSLVLGAAALVPILVGGGSHYDQPDARG